MLNQKELIKKIKNYNPFLNPDTLFIRLPALRLLTRKYKDIKSMADALCPAVANVFNNVASVEVIDCNSQIGSGALPVDLLPSAGLCIKPLFNQKLSKLERSRTLSVIAKKFRNLPLPVIGKLNNGALILDLRCLEKPSSLTNQLPRLHQMFGFRK